jgi:uncharacterized protein YxeA
VADIKTWIVNGSFFDIDVMINRIPSLFVIGVTFYFIGETIRYREGYTTVTTTKYNLYKCREKNKEESFMMFADSEEELERYFKITHPEKEFFIESAELSGKSISMKILNNPTNE